MNHDELVDAIYAVRAMEGSNFDKGYAGAPLFCKIEGIGPVELLKIIAIDQGKEGADVEFNGGAIKWCNEQIEDK